MGMPQIPDGANRPTLDQTIIDLLESIALEEMAMAHIMNAEGEKMQEVIKQYGCNDISLNQLDSSCQDTQSMMSNLIMKEWLLLNKMHSILKISDHAMGKEKERCHLPKQHPCNCEHCRQL